MEAKTTATSSGQYLLQAKVLQLKGVEIADPKPHEVQLAPKSTTLCGSDLHYYNHGRNGSITVKEPLCLGHEFAGEVLKVGNAVEGLKPGDKIAVECGVPCLECDLCLSKRYNICPKLRFRGSGSAFPHFQGSLQQKINHPAQWTHKLPTKLSFEDGALLEPLAVACHAVRRARIESSSTCLVIGAGAVGLLCAAVIRSKGCSRIVICDIDKRRVDFAVENGFAEKGWVVERQSASTTEDQMANAASLASKIGSQVWPDGVQVGKLGVTFECTGAPSCVQGSIYATKSGGRVMLVGMGTPNHTLPLSEAGAREIDLMPTWRYAHCYEEAIELMNLVAEGTVKPDIRKIITHRFTGLSNVREAFALAGSPSDSNQNLVIKVAVNA